MIIWTQQQLVLSTRVSRLFIYLYLCVCYLTNPSQYTPYTLMNYIKIKALRLKRSYTKLYIIYHLFVGTITTGRILPWHDIVIDDTIMHAFSLDYILKISYTSTMIGTNITLLIATALTYRCWCNAWRRFKNGP